MTSKYSLGELVSHKLFDYRGVIVSVDETFAGTDEWYDFMARSKPPKDAPWYHVLVHGGVHRTYVAERNLQPDESSDEIQHPEVPLFFDRFENGVYTNTRVLN